MSAIGTQLNPEPQLTHFHPTLREYLQSLKTALAAKDLPAAQQAHAQLTKTVQSAAQGQTGETAIRTHRGLQDVGKALEAGNIPGAAQAVDELPQDFRSIFAAGQAQPQDVAELASGNSSDVSATVDSNPATGSNLNVSV